MQLQLDPKKVQELFDQMVAANKLIHQRLDTLEAEIKKLREGGTTSLDSITAIEGKISEIQVKLDNWL